MLSLTAEERLTHVEDLIQSALDYSSPDKSNAYLAGGYDLAEAISTDFAQVRVSLTTEEMLQRLEKWVQSWIDYIVDYHIPYQSEEYLEGGYALAEDIAKAIGYEIRHREDKNERQGKAS